MGAGDDVLNIGLPTTIVPFDAWDNKSRGPAEVLEIWRKWTRLTNLALTGLLHDFAGSMIETEDVRLIQELAVHGRPLG
jgi:hypothetical protein